MAETEGVDLNAYFKELADWETQLKPLDHTIFDKIEEMEL